MSGLTLIAVTVAFAVPSNIPVDVVLETPERGRNIVVHTAGDWHSWRTFTLSGAKGLNRGERCRAKIDASRVLRHKPVTQGLPRRCMTDFDKKQRPDPKF